MVSVSYTDVHTPMNLTVNDISATNTEILMDVAIDSLNLEGDLSLDNMSGAAGSKTVTLTQRQRAAVLFTTRAIYYGWYKNIDTASVGGVVVIVHIYLRNPAIFYNHYAIQLFAFLVC